VEGPGTDQLTKYDPPQPQFGSHLSPFQLDILCDLQLQKTGGLFVRVKTDKEVGEVAANRY
jgi:hypothetical protein